MSLPSVSGRLSAPLRFALKSPVSSLASRQDEIANFVSRFHGILGGRASARKTPGLPLGPGSRPVTKVVSPGPKVNAGSLCHSLSATNLPKQRTTASVSFVEISCHETDCDSLTLVDFFSKTLPSSTKKLCSKEGRVLANGPSFETIEKKSGKSMSLALAKGNTNRPLKIAF